MVEAAARRLSGSSNSSSSNAAATPTNSTAATSWPFIWNFTFYNSERVGGFRAPGVADRDAWCPPAGAAGGATATATATSNYKRCTHSNPRPLDPETNSNSNLSQQFLTVAIALATVPPKCPHGFWGRYGMCTVEKVAYTEIFIKIN